MATEKTVTLPDNTANELLRTEASITRQSVELGRLEIKLDAVKSGLHAMYSFKEEIILKFLKEMGVDQKDLAFVNLSSDGKQITATFKDRVPVSAPTPYS
jgi:hypothetical protein